MGNAQNNNQDFSTSQIFQDQQNSQLSGSLINGGVIDGGIIDGGSIDGGIIDGGNIGGSIVLSNSNSFSQGSTSFDTSDLREVSRGVAVILADSSDFVSK